MIGYCKHFKREVLSESDCYYCIKGSMVNPMIYKDDTTCWYWTTKMITKYKCSLCGRDKFDKPYVIHWCKNNFRKHRFGEFEKNSKV